MCMTGSNCGHVSFTVEEWFNHINSWENINYFQVDVN